MWHVCLKTTNTILHYNDDNNKLGIKSGRESFLGSSKFFIHIIKAISRKIDRLHRLCRHIVRAVSRHSDLT